MSRGHFFSFEGIDGCGKTTQIEKLSMSLKDLNKPFITLREPGGTAISEEIRSILLNSQNKIMTYEVEAMLMAASRIQLLREVIVPEINSGKVILCDRYIDSSLAYQGAGRGLSVTWLKHINRYAFELAIPNKTFLLDIPVLDAMSRLKNRTRDRIESSGQGFLQRVRDGFVTLANNYPDRYIILNGQKKPELLAKEILDHIKRILE